MATEIKEGLYYSDEHEWVRVDGEKAYIGITDFAQHQLGDIVFVELPDLDSEFEAGESIGVIESVKAVSDMHTPVSGMVIAVNEGL
jgi:glycine cleavage system H protein